MKTLKKDLHIIARGYRIIFSIDTKLIPLNICSAFLEAVYPFIIIYMGSEILNALSRRENIRDIYMLLLVMIALNSATQQIKQMLMRTINVKNEAFHHKYKMFLSNKTLGMDYASIENPETHLKRQRIDDRMMVSGGIYTLVYQSRDVIGGMFTVLSSIAITYKAFIITGEGSSPFLSIALLVFIVLSTLLSIKCSAVSTLKSYDILDNLLPQNRLLGFLLVKYLNSYQTGKDIRLYNQKQMVMDSLKKALSVFKKEFIKMERNQIKYADINTLLSSFTGWLIYIIIGLKASYGLIVLGDLFKYIYGIMQFNTGINNFLNSFNTLRTNNGNLEILFEYLDMPNAMHIGSLTTEKRADNDYELEFHQVSFKYPGTDTYALRNLSLKFKIGERMAVVGMNGSGKTTMIKLLCRLYDPTEGKITLNGINIKNYEFAEYINIFSVVFQDFTLFSFSFGQNIAASIRYDSARAEQCLHMVGFESRMSNMPKGLETPLYKDFDEDGVEISGGEAQKIALARALYKDTSFIILDEPTAALDPVSEFEIYSKINEIIHEKTAVYISHRLSSCRFCNDIVVFHEGELIQRGNHDVLLSDKDGKYYELWNAQAQYYT